MNAALKSTPIVVEIEPVTGEVRTHVAAREIATAIMRVRATYSFVIESMERDHRDVVLTRLAGVEACLGSAMTELGVALVTP
jgi:hypothetical protein